ncbi:hypothetical protein BCR42DRAFT_489949 [Absidia repens]|uniref:SUR7/PalI family-domain-containing protein n=1 Tax=Absidia repens TaxID=90262 RepID=A0A1X2ILH2_9FUNG|nr:hypothetical protein BCR42DRAFT_489949 [Absidia repens]
MPTYKRSSYDLFIHKVLLPNIRTILLVLAVVALGCGSWLETNTSNDCAFQNTISVFEVSIYQNISDPYALTPSSVTFGLWKHCFYYAQNCTCTPIRLNYQLDAEQSIYAATNNQTMPTIDANHASYIRLIPLIMALILSTASFGYSFWANRSHSRPLFFWINGAVALLAAALVALALGYTYQSYKSSIVSACQAVNDQSVRCASMSPKLEVILLALALGLLVLSSALFGCVRKPDFGDSTTHEIYIDEKSPSSSSSKRPSTLFEPTNRKSGGRLSRPSESLAASKNPAMYDMSSDEALEAWRDATLLERHEQQRQHDHHYYQQQEQHQHDMWAMPLRPPPPPAALNDRRSNDHMYNRQPSSDTRAYPTNGTSSTPSSSSASVSSSSLLPSAVDMYSGNENDKKHQQYRRRSSSSPRQEKTQYYQDGDISSGSNELLPPTLPFAGHPQRRRKSSSQPQHQLRPISHASGNTFGAEGVLLMDNSPLSSTCTLEEQQHHRTRHYSDASFRANTPTSYNYDHHHSGSHESVCFTPTFHHRSSSGVSTASQQHQQYNDGMTPPLTATNGRRKNSNGSPTVLYQHTLGSSHHHSRSSSSHQQSHVPTLQIPPPSRHPLNHKVIKDERIGAYFQQHQPNRTP